MDFVKCQTYHSHIKALLEVANLKDKAICLLWQVLTLTILLVPLILIVTVPVVSLILSEYKR